MQFAPEFVRAIEERLMSERRGRRVNLQGAPQIEFSCPTHDDAHQSAHYHAKKMVWTCRSCPAGGGLKNLAQALGIDTEHATPANPRRQPTRGEEPVATYEYTSVKGVKALKKRYEFPDELDAETGKPKKTFTWTSAAGTKLPEGTSVKDMNLYFLEDPAARPDDPIIFVEGEKTAQACWQRQLLACTGGWASSLREWNAAVWEPLRGREVWLSPDNDRAGFEYMDAVAAALRNIAKKVRRVKVALPPKGDLVEFFAAGGKPEDIFTGDLDETAIDILDHDSIRVRIPTEDGVVALLATQLHRGPRDLDAKLRVEVERPGCKPYSGRINLLSATAQGSLRLTLSRMYPDVKCNWTEVVNEACSAIDEAFANVDVSVDVFDIPDAEDGEQFYFGDLLPIGQPTIFFGDGGSLKTYVTEYFGALLTVGLPFPGSEWGGAPEPGRAMYCDWENATPAGFRRRLKRLYAGIQIQDIYPDMFTYWPGRGVPLVHQVDALRKKIREDNIRYLIIDSAAAACGGKPEDSDLTVAFFNALAYLETTTAVIAHVNSQQDKTKPFGSIFWKNLARRVWYVQASGRGDDREIGLFCRKVNDGPMGTHKALGAHFIGANGEVEITRKSFFEVDRALDRERPMGIRLQDALGRSSMTASELASHLGSKAETVQQWLKRYPDLFRDLGPLEEGKPNAWGLAARAG